MTYNSISGNSDTNREIILWGFNYLISQGYKLKSDLPETVKETPWSYVARFEAFDGYIYLKQTPKLLALEAVIHKILHDKFHASVPDVIAHNTELNCFLMKDAGIPLRDILKKNFDMELLSKAIYQFTSLQVTVADHVNIFLEIGVPDWRLDKLPDLYMQLLSEKNILMLDGLSEIEINKLETLHPTVTDLCKNLSDYSIQQTIVQPDFNDNNLLLDVTTQKITLIDLGEIVISHPFFSLINFLKQMKRHHAVKDDSFLMDACLENFTKTKSKKDLIKAFEIACKLWFIYEALANYRLMCACDKETYSEFKRNKKLSRALKEFMNT